MKYNKRVRVKLKELEDLKRRVKSLNREADLADKIEQQHFPGCMIEVMPFLGIVDITASAKSTHEMVPVIEQLAEEGYKLKKSRFLTEDSVFKKYDFGRIIVYLNLGDSDVCRVIQTGVKQVPVFKRVCEEEKADMP